MAKRRRKTLVVCEACHASIHPGEANRVNHGIVAGEPGERKRFTPGSGGRRRRRTSTGTSPTSYLDRPPASDRCHARCPPGRSARSRPADRQPRTAPHPPRLHPNALPRQAAQRDRRRVRPRARVLPLGRRDRALTSRSQPPVREAGAPGRDAAGTREPTMSSPLRPRSLLDQRTPAAGTRPWGTQNPRIIRLATPTTCPTPRPPEQPTDRPPTADAIHPRPLDKRHAISVGPSAHVPHRPVDATGPNVGRRRRISGP